MPITAQQFDALILCDPCHDNLTYEPADIAVECGNEVAGYETVRICYGCQGTDAWRGADGPEVKQPSEALAAWDDSTLAERNAAIVDLVGEEARRTAGEGRGARPVPKFTHDCGSCTFLGRATDPEGGREADLYHCLDITGPTVIARWSNEGRDYTSGMVFARPGTLLGIAKDLAEAKGLDVTVIR